MGVKVTMIAATPNPNKVVALIWQMSKTTEEINWSMETGPDLITKLMEEEVPVLRHIKFTFIIEDMSISFREQLVRTQWDDYWIQSGRITDWENLKTEDPKCCEDGVLGLIYEDIMDEVFNFVALAKEKGYAPEDYRDIIPVGALHRGAWTCSLQSLLQRLRKRTCWVAQSDKWFPVLYQVSEQIRDYNAAFTDICLPPCKDREWNHKGCTIAQTMSDRVAGTDPLPVCPIYAQYEMESEDYAITLCRENREHVDKLERMWGRDLASGTRRTVRDRHGDDGS